MWLDIRSILRMRRGVARVVRRCGVHERDVDDVTQEALAGAWMATEGGGYRPDDDTPRSLAAWLRGIAWRQASNHRRAAWRRREQPHEPAELDVEDEAPGAEADLMTEERARLLHELLRRMPDERRQVVAAHELGGAEMTDVARRLGIPLSTAWSRHRLGMRYLRAAARRHNENLRA